MYRSRGFFISQLRALFEQASVDEALSSQIDRFLDATSHFLDLLLGIRNLPPGDEFLDDRIIGTLRLMSYIRDISSSQIFCKCALFRKALIRPTLMNFYCCCCPQMSSKFLVIFRSERPVFV